MRVEYAELMEHLGTGHVLSPYETRPWFHYDAEQGITCSAEVRIGPGADDVEAEIQYLYDEEDGRYEDESSFAGPEQIMHMRFLPSKEQIWSGTHMVVKGEDYKNQIHNWDERGCEFFTACIGALQMGELPDIDELIEEILTDRDRYGGRGRKGKVGKKGFKVQQKPVSFGMK